jgi:hypothetical protein
MSSWDRRIPFPSLHGHRNPTTRRARLLAARSYPQGSRPRWGIMLGHWDGGTILEKFGMPKRFRSNWKNAPCEALEKQT